MIRDRVSFTRLHAPDQIVGTLHADAVSIHDAPRGSISQWRYPVRCDADQVPLNRVECSRWRNENSVSQVTCNLVARTGRDAADQGVGNVVVDEDPSAVRNRRRTGGVRADSISLDCVIRTEDLDAVAVGNNLLTAKSP